MSLPAIRKALEQALESITPVLATEFENQDFTIPKTDPYQSVRLFPGDPVNATFGDDQRREQGFMQVLLKYPKGEGSGDAAYRAELIRDTFTRGSTWTADGVTIVISNTPSIHPEVPNDSRYVIPVRIRYWAYIS